MHSSVFEMAHAVRAAVALLLLAAPAGASSLGGAGGPKTCPEIELSPRSDAIDRIVIEQMKSKHVPGLAIVLMDGGRVVKLRGYGYADLKSCRPVDIHTRFGIGSISKQMAAVGFLTLVRDGALSLDDPITKYFPEGKGSWDGIRLRDLLTHTSGIPDIYGDDSQYPSISFDRTASPATDELVREFTKMPRNFQPRDDWAYSDPPYILLGIIAERVTHQSFPAFMHERVFAPLGMAGSGVYRARSTEPDRATPYHVDSDGTVSDGAFISDVWSRWGDTGFVSTASDMARWATALGRDPLLPEQLWREMLTPVKLADGTAFPYGFGIRLGQVGDEPVWSHGGTFRAGYSGMFVKFPRRGIAAAVLSNYWGDDLPGAAIVQLVVGKIAPELAPPDMHPVKPDPDPQMTAMLLSALEGKDPAHGAAATTSSFDRHEDLHKRFAEALSKEGAKARLQYVGCSPVGGAAPAALGTPVVRRCSYRLQGQEGLPPGVTFWLTKSGEIAGLSLW